MDKLNYKFHNRGSHQSGDRYLDASTAQNICDKIDELIDTVIYSTKEKIVGTWINGKNIYQKVLLLNPTTGDWEAHPHGITGVSEFLPFSCAILHRQYGQYVPLSFCYPVENKTSLYSAGWQISLNNIELWIGNSMFQEIDTTNYGVVVVLFYTK